MIKLYLTGIEGVQKALEEIPRKAKRKLKEIANIFVDELSTGASMLNRAGRHGFGKRGSRRWQLSSSFKYRVTSDGRVEIYSNVPYAMIHDIGGEIVSSGKLMKVPITYDITYTRSLNTKSLSPKTGNENRIIWGKDRRAKFILKRRVKIVRQPYVNAAIERATPRMMQEMEDLVEN